MKRRKRTVRDKKERVDAKENYKENLKEKNAKVLGERDYFNL